MRVFLDFEASSLSDDSYPIEVGWVLEDGTAESWLICPAAAWTDWDAGAEAIHHISRSQLEADGAPHDQVARRILETLGAHDVYVSAPSWDGKWLSVLLRAAGLPRHAMRLKDSEEAFRQAAVEILEPVAGQDVLEAQTARVIDTARRLVSEPPVHRALADARRELRLWLEVQRVAHSMAEAFTG